MLISATHTHSAASALGGSRYVSEQALDDYQRFVARRIADGVRRAVNILRPAQIAFGTAEAPEHVFNRRWFMREGTVPPNPFGKIDKVKMNPPVGSPDLVEPAGPTDPDGLLHRRARAGRAADLAVFAPTRCTTSAASAAAHISADYYGMFCEALKKLQPGADNDPPFVAMMANGTSGDINNINFRTPRPAGRPTSRCATSRKTWPRR